MLEKSRTIFQNSYNALYIRPFIASNKKYNGIGCFIEDFIEYSHQFGMIDKRSTGNMRDRVKASMNHSKMESIS